MKRIWLFSIFIINSSFSMEWVSKTFLNIKAKDLKDEKNSKLLEVTLKYALIRGHEFVHTHVSEMDLFKARTYSIPALTLKSAKCALAYLITQTSQERAITFIEEGFQKFMRQKLPIKVQRGNFKNKWFAQLNAVYLYYGITNFNELRKNILKDTKNQDEDADAVFCHHIWLAFFPAPFHESVDYKEYDSKFITRSRL